MTSQKIETSPLYDEADEIARQLLSDPPDDPYPLYHRLREIAPVHQMSTTGDWVVSSYELLADALREPRFVRDFDDLMRRQHGGEVDYARPILKHRACQFSHANPPEYMKKRSVLSKSITPVAVSKLEEEITGYVNELLDAAEAQGGEVDLIEHFSHALPLKLICRVLGFPSPEGNPAWLGSFSAYGSTFLPSITEQMLDDADKAILDLNEMMAEQLETMRTSSSDTMITQVLRAQEQGAPLSDDDLMANTIFMLAAAVHTSAALIGNAILALLHHRDQWELLVADPVGRAKGAVEEALRYDNAVLANPPSRLAVEDVEIGGFTIRAGEVMIPLYGPANRDPKRYPNPDAFDITREDVRPLSFGGGPHVCPGQHLVRTQTQIALRILATRFPNMRLVDEDAPRLIMPLQREVGALRVRLT
ncbi:cytochrome P450 [Streptomyces plumbiresistens]|uniref:Cytochrome P450 n=1 Tax=Streptomyces plumbiresistens TaxID=511811 RepID=A0ABP7SJZ8_9ACTN